MASEVAVHQPWTSGRPHTPKASLQRSSVLVSGNSTWYDVPAPVIVHGRFFGDDPEPETEDPREDPQHEHREVVVSEIEKPSQVQPVRSNRHSSSVELTAATKIDTDLDGVPTITFTFVRADQQQGGDVVDGCSPGPTPQLYDLPRSESGYPAITTAAASSDNLYDELGSPSSAKQATQGTSANGVNTSSSSSGGSSSAGSSSTKSRAAWRRSLGKLEEFIARPGNNAAATGSYSDSEAVTATKRSGPSSRRPSVSGSKKRAKLWARVRGWLSDERSRLGEVVARHARLQAVGARLHQHQAGPKKSSSSGVLEERSRSGSYNVARAQKREWSNHTQSPVQVQRLPRVEEFGPSAVVGSDFAIKKTASSDDILATGHEARPRHRPPPLTSFSLERLDCDDELERDNDDEEEDDNGNANGVTTANGPRGKDQGKRAKRRGLVRRRMLGSLRGLIASTNLLHEIDESGPGGFEEVRRYVKQGGDFCKELAAILHERAELEANYAKGLSKLSVKLTKACAKDQAGGNGGGGVSEAWRSVGEEMEAAAEAHRTWGAALGEQLAKPLRVGVAEVQGRSRKSIEAAVDKASKSLQEWRAVATKSKKQSFACARENERLQDLARLHSLSSSASKLELRRKKAEEAARRADGEFYTVTVRAERARLEHECAVRKAAKQMELLEEERLSALKDLANVYLAHLHALAPKLQQSADRLSGPIRSCSVSQDVEILRGLIRRMDSNESPSTEQLLPDFYAEHVTLAMNRERRKQALVRVLHLIRQDLERERRGREGLETLHRAFIKTPAFAADESTQNVTDKLLHMRSMLLYLEAARFKVGGALSELEGGKRGDHPLAEHILVSRDKQGLQQSVLKVPSWAKSDSFELQDACDAGDLETLRRRLSKAGLVDCNNTTNGSTDEQHKNHQQNQHQRDWSGAVDRTAGDGNSENPPDEGDYSDFDEFSSNSEDNNNADHQPHHLLDGSSSGAGSSSPTSTSDKRTERCRAMYEYAANLNDELDLSPGDLIIVHEKQPDGWWIGECKGRTGIFPATYVQLIH
ncbi:hypothetical protein QAD02_008514 [Eretmocerus hayati]|uniref:Uncharacterized protein n=1 Tax=Eretmocerus hayati TaxID=131215 RepID=A0ACC2N933_9HYME|nr:hypothetical protein QAD02_008514 [Eretmocerus hayati]